MKTVKSFLVLFVALVSFSAFAEDARVFQKMSGEAFPVFKQTLEQRNLLKKDVREVEFFDTKVLAEAACKFGEENRAALYQKYGTAEKCQGVFIARNNLGATMTLDEFRAQGQGVGFWLADISAQAAVPASQVDVLAELARMKAEIAKISASKQQDAKFAAQLAAIQRQVNGLMKREGGHITTKQLEAIMSDLENANKKYTEAVNGRIDTLAQGQAALKARVDPLEEKVNNSTLLKWEKTVLTVLGLIVLVLVGSALMVYFRAMRGKKAQVRNFKVAPTAEPSSTAPEMPLAA